LDKTFEEENRALAVAKQFDCSICIETKPITDNCITLDCLHRFCKHCLA